MSGFRISVRVVIPILILILLGALLKRLGLVDAKSLDVMDNIGFRVFLPTQLFYSIFRTDRDLVRYRRPILTGLLFIAVIFAVSFLLFTFLEKDPFRRGPMIQCEIRINFVIFGMAIASQLYGAEHTGLIAVMAAVIIPVTSTAAAVLFEVYRGGKVSAGRLTANALKNPFLIGAALGTLFLALGIPLPGPVESVVRELGNMATPFCLIVLGGCTRFPGFRSGSGPLFLASAIKSFVIPGVFIPIAVALGFRGQELAALAIAMASPTAVSGFTLARQSGADGELAGQLVVVTTLCSVFTMFLVIWILTAKALI